MKKIVSFMLIMLLLLSAYPIASTQAESSREEPIRSTAVGSYTDANVHHVYVTAGMTKTSGTTWNSSVTVNILSLSVPSGTKFKTTLVDSNGNAIGGWKIWDDGSTSTTLSISSGNTGVSSVHLELRNTKKIGYVVSSGTFSGTYN